MQTATADNRPASKALTAGVTQLTPMQLKILQSIALNSTAIGALPHQATPKQLDEFWSALSFLSQNGYARFVWKWNQWVLNPSGCIAIIDAMDAEEGSR